MRADYFGGALTWQEPSNLSKVESYAIYLAPGIVNIENTRVQVGGQDLAVGNMSLTIPFGRPFSSFTHIVLYTANSEGRQSFPAAIRVHDVVRPSGRVNSLTFFDTDIDKGELVGDLSWSRPATSLEYVTLYRVYIATNAFLDDKELLLEVPVGTNQVQLGRTDPLEHCNFTHFGVFVANADEEADIGEAFKIEDRAVPLSSVSGLSFTDIDLEADLLEGTLSWISPKDTSDVTFYRAYLAEDEAMTGSVQLGSDVPVDDASQVAIGPHLLLGAFAYFVVYTANGIGMQRVPLSLPIADRGIRFLDTDLRRGYIAGRVTWWNGAGSAPARLRTYLAAGPEADAMRQEFAHGMRHVDFTRQPQQNQLLELIVQDPSGDLFLSDDLKWPTSQGILILALKGSRLLFTANFSGQPLVSLVLPFSLVFGEDVDPGNPTFNLPSLNLASFGFLQVAAQTAHGASLGLRVGVVIDRAVPEFPVQRATFVDHDFDRHKIGGMVRWEPPEIPAYSLRCEGACARPLTTTTDCEAAAVSLSLKHTTVIPDSHGGVSYDPPFCYHKSGTLKFEVDGNNIGSCSKTSQCLCDVFDDGSPPVTHYAIYLADGESMGSNHTLLQEVAANVTEVEIEFGTRPWRWALVLVGGEEGLNITLPISVRLKDLALFGEYRAAMEAQLLDHA